MLTFILNDSLAGVPIVVALSSDTVSFVVFERPPRVRFSLVGDSLWDGRLKYDLAGHCIDHSVPALFKVPAYQEFWHSWQTFHPQ